MPEYFDLILKGKLGTKGQDTQEQFKTTSTSDVCGLLFLLVIGSFLAMQ